MKHLLGLVVFLITLPTAAQDAISGIRITVEHINNDSGYVTKTFNNEEFLEQMGDGGGVLTGYYKDGALVKMIEWIGLSSCVNKTEYFLQGNKLIFAYIEGSEAPYIDSLATFDHRKQDKTMECRFYYHQEKMIKSIFKGSTRCGGEPLDSWAPNYLKAANRYKDLFTTN